MADQVKTFAIEIERDEAGYWIATAPEVPAVITQAKRLDKIVERAQEAIAVLLDIDEATFDVELHVPLLDDVPFREAREAREKAEAAQIEATEKVREVVHRLIDEKALTMRDTGQLLGISHQRVEQIAKHDPTPARKTAKRAPRKAPKRTRVNA